MGVYYNHNLSFKRVTDKVMIQPTPTDFETLTGVKNLQAKKTQQTQVGVKFDLCCVNDDKGKTEIYVQSRPA